MEIILTSIIAFASTNIDDIFILILFFGDKKYKAIDIWLGQYSGIIVLIGTSLVGSLIGNFVDSKYVGLLGLFPIYLGVRSLIGLLSATQKDDGGRREFRNSKTGILSVATVTIANGGDNIGVYVPLFATLTPSEKSVMVAIFMVMMAIWLAIARYLTTHPVLAIVIDKYGHVVTPIVLCLLGLFILRENGTLQLLP